MADVKKDDSKSVLDPQAEADAALSAKIQAQVEAAFKQNVQQALEQYGRVPDVIADNLPDYPKHPHEFPSNARASVQASLERRPCAAAVHEAYVVPEQGVTLRELVEHRYTHCKPDREAQLLSEVVAYNKLRDPDAPLAKGQVIEFPAKTEHFDHELNQSISREYEKVRNIRQNAGLWEPERGMVDRTGLRH